MKRADHLESMLAPVGDPLDAIVALAQDVRASAIAWDARRVNERLDSARLVVSIVARPATLAPLLERITGRVMAPWRFLAQRPLMIRFGRGPGHLRLQFRDGPPQNLPIARTDDLASLGERIISADLVVESAVLQRGTCFAVATPETPWPPYRRIDLLLVDEEGARAIERVEKWSRVRALLVASARPAELDGAFTIIDQMAREANAVCVEAHVAQHHRHLCKRLRHHLFEHQRALGRSNHDMLARINALTIARVLAESVLDARARQPDAERERLVDSLFTERTKFLMGTKADALVAFEDRIVQMREPRHQLRWVAAVAAREIVVELLARLWERMRSKAERPVAALSKRLLADLDMSLSDLDETVPLDAMAGVDLSPIRGFRRDLACPPPSGMIAQLADRMGLASRRRIESAARDDVVDSLDRGSRALVARVLEDYDDTRAAIERRYCELIDGALQSVHCAAEFASEAQANGADGVARARSRVAQWSAMVSEIGDRLD